MITNPNESLDEYLFQTFYMAKDNPSLDCSQDSFSGSSSTTQSTQEVSSDQKIIDVNNSLKSSPRSLRPKIYQLHHNDDRHDEKQFHTIKYHNLRVDPLFYDDEKHRKLPLLLYVLFLINIYGPK